MPQVTTSRTGQRSVYLEARTPRVSARSAAASGGRAGYDGD